MSYLPNYENDSLVLGLSNLGELRRNRPMLMNRGRGVFVFDEQGKDYIEAVSSLYCAALGFSDEELIEAAIRQMRELPVYPSALNRTVPVVVELAEALQAAAPFPDAFVLFSTTGSEAIDGLIKLMWYGNIHSGHPKRRKIISRWGSYHGATIYTSALGGGTPLHRSFGLPEQDFLYVSHPNWPNGAASGETEAEYTAALVEELRGVVEANDPETIGAFIAEPVSVSGGVFAPPASYFGAIKTLLSGYGIRLFADEVVSGFGRTGSMWGSQTYAIDPDCLVAAKGLSSAYQPISALLMKPDFYRGLERGNEATGNFAHGGTYHAHPVAAAVALETLRIFERRRIVEHVRAILPAWQAILRRLSTHPLVRETRHAGLLGALEIGLPGAERRNGVATSLSIGGLPRQVYEAGLERGIITRPLAGCIVLAPPLIISEAELEELERRLRRSLDAVLAQQLATDLHPA